MDENPPENRQEHKPGDVRACILIESCIRRLDKLDNLLLSLISIISIMFTIVAAVTGGIDILFLVPVLIPGIFLAIYYGYYRPISNTNIYKCICCRVIGWTFFIDGTLIYLVLYTLLMLNEHGYPYIHSPYPIDLVFISIIYFISYVILAQPLLNSVKIVCKTIDCYKIPLIYLKLTELRTATRNVALYYFYFCYGFYVFYDILKGYYNFISGENLQIVIINPMLTHIIMIVATVFTVFAMYYFVRKLIHGFKYINENC